MSEFTAESIAQLGALHIEAAQVIARNETPLWSREDTLDASGGDLIVTNLYVICDRLSHGDFSVLSQEVRDQVAVVAHIAQDTAPPDPADLEKLSDETEEQFAYRTTIKLPIHFLQRMLHGPNYDPSDRFLVSKLKFAIEGSAHAFAGVLYEMQNNPAVRETIGYFQNNTQGAITRANHVISEQQRVAEQATD